MMELSRDKKRTIKESLSGTLFQIVTIKSRQGEKKKTNSMNGFRSEGENDESSQHSLYTVTEGRRGERSRVRTTLLLRDVRGAKCQRCDSNEEESFTPTWNANEKEPGQALEKCLQQVHLLHTNTPHYM